MSGDKWVLRTYNRKGDLMERTERNTRTAEADLREQAQNATQVRGQLGWRCDLFRNGVRVATYRRGAWKDVVAR